MNWLVFVYSLPTRNAAGTRTSIWRALRKLGALHVPGGAHVLPDRPDCRDALRELCRTVRKSRGEAIVLHGSVVDGMTDAELVAGFVRERSNDYQELVVALSRNAAPRLATLRRQLASIARIDYFDSPDRARAETELRRMEQQTGAWPAQTGRSTMPLSAYRGRRWVTASRPGPDALACAWLIRRFVDPSALIRYADRARQDEVAFDLATGEFAHHGRLCAFERMVFAFSLETPALTRLGEIVHELDLHDGRFRHAESAGIDAALRGWRLTQQLSDAEIEARGRVLFDGAHAALQLSVMAPAAARGRGTRKGAAL